jgi:hypothetical protein
MESLLWLSILFPLIHSLANAFILLSNLFWSHDTAKLTNTEHNIVT